MADEYQTIEESTHLMRAAIDAAFCSEVDRCFGSLTDGLEQGSEEVCREQFRVGVDLAERAREIALGVVRGR